VGRRPGPADGLAAITAEGDKKRMSGLDWFFAIGLGVLYLVLLFTVCVLTFRKGHWVLGILGIFLPFLWLIGAVLPSKRRYAR
jgi:hypothetical protein